MARSSHKNGGLEIEQQFILASQSPQRLTLLRQLFPSARVDVSVSGVLERYIENENAEARVIRLAEEKACAVRSTYKNLSPETIIVAADTEIVLDDKALGKPSDDAAAIKMLRSLSGRTHLVVTGWTLSRSDHHSLRSGVEVTEVEFQVLSEETLHRYVQSGEPMGKAGSYGIQGRGVCLVEKISGSYSCIVGLPLERLARVLQYEFNVCVF